MICLAQCLWCHEMILTTVAQSRQRDTLTNPSYQQAPIATAKQHAQLVGLCSACLQALPKIQSPCTQCAMPIGGAHPDHVKGYYPTPISPSISVPSTDIAATRSMRCGQCQNKPPIYDYCYAAYRYQFPISHWIKQIKDKGQLAITGRLEQLLQKYLSDHSFQPDLIVAMPTLKRRLFKRGCNLSELLAIAAADTLNCPVVTLGMEIHTPKTQRGQTRLQRLISGKNKFSIRTNNGSNRDFINRHILIVDDVMTTGATAAAIAQQLKNVGAGIVGILVLARAI